MPAGFYDSKGQLQELSFTKAFFGFYGPRTIRQPKKAVQATEAPKPDASAPVPSPAQPTPAPVEDKKPTEDATPTEEPLTWTSLEDATLIGLKALNKTWKEIGVIMSPKQTEDLRERYDELKEITIAAQQAEAKDKKAEAKKVEDDTKEDSESAGEGAKKKKGKGKKNKEMSAEALEKKAKAMAAKAEAEAEKANLEETNPDSSYEKPLKSILKKGFATQKMDHSSQFPSQYQGRPIIYVDDGDVMSMDDLRYIFYTHKQMERNLWLDLASRFFDKTGKRVAPEVLKEKLKNC